jgi:hypothetical protein
MAMRPAARSPRGCRRPRSRTPSGSAHAYAREQLGTEVLRAAERAAQRRREAERTYEQAVGRTARLGVVQRDAAAAARVADGTNRAVLTRAQLAGANECSWAKARPPRTRGDPGVAGGLLRLVEAFASGGVCGHPEECARIFGAM